MAKAEPAIKKLGWTFFFNKIWIYENLKTIFEVKGSSCKSCEALSVPIGGIVVND